MTTSTKKPYWELEDADFSHLDIIAEIEQHAGTRLTKRHGPCPYPDCSSQRDGFMVWEQLTDSNCHFYCRQCKRAGNIVKLIMDIKGLKAYEVCDLLQIGDPDAENRPRYQREKSASELKEEARLERLRDLYEGFRATALQHPRALAYFAQRGIPLEVVEALGIAYCAPVEREKLKSSPNLWEMRLWTDRIIFPLPNKQFSGRSLYLWTPGMDENKHKELLDTFNKKVQAFNARMEAEHGKEAYKYKKDEIPRWKTTAGGGYFRADILNDLTHATFMEGPFDVCAAYAAGVKDAIATGTNSVNVNTIPLKICDVTLAYDGDGAGAAAADQWEKKLRRKGIAVNRILPPDDGLGKDWNERYRRSGIDGLAPLLQPVQSEPAPAPAARELTEEELFQAMPPEAQQSYLAALAEPIPCSSCLDEGIVTPLDPDQEFCPRHAPAAPRLTRDEIIQRFHALPDMVVSEVIPIAQEAAMKARVEQEYQDRDRHYGRQGTRTVFDYKKQPRWEDHGFVKDPQGNWREERRYRKELQESINHAINKNKQASVDNVPAPEQLV